MKDDIFIPLIAVIFVIGFVTFIALELAALFLFDDVRLILHTAHEFKTAAEAFLRIQSLIAENRKFESRVSRIRTAAGMEAIERKNGKRR